MNSQNIPKDIIIDIDTQKGAEVIITPKGTKLEVPNDISWVRYYNTMQDVLCLLKEKGLTIKQAQEVCIGSAELILDRDFN